MVKNGAKTLLALVLTCCAAWSVPAAAEEFLLADGKSWPGKILVQHAEGNDTVFIRPEHQAEDDVPRVQSLTTLADGRIVFCSGLDRSIQELTQRGERRLHHGGYVARQVRTDAQGKLWWSGLETPKDANPLPDGFLYTLDPKTGETKTELTFSQGDVGRDWWGAFDIFEGRIFVSTLQGQTRLYEVTSGVAKPVATLPISATAFRLQADGSLLACDGKGSLYRFADYKDPQQGEVILESSTPFVDFAVAPKQN